MFKTFFLLSAGDAAFASHGDEAAQAVSTVMPNAVGYVQTSALGESPYSGCAEVYFRFARDAMAAESVDISALLAEGISVESKMSGMLRVVMRMPKFYGAEKMKGVYPFRRKPGMEVQDFQDRWWHTHGPIAALTEESLAYSQTHPMMACYEDGSPDFDGVTEIYWPDVQAAERAVVSRQMAEDQRHDAENFVDLENVTLFFGSEEVVVAP